MLSRTTAVFILLVLALVPVTGVLAEDAGQSDERPTPPEEFPQALGGFFGLMSGIGIQYHRWNGQNGFHIAGGIIYNLELWLSIGAEYQRMLFGESFTNWLAGSLYLFAGGSMVAVLPGQLTAGGGVGTEIILWRHVSIPIELGYAATWEWTADTPAQSFRVELTPQIGLRYRF